MKFTILGSSGFIGSHFCEYLRLKNVEYFAPQRDYVFNPQDKLGHVVYCIGLTADFRDKPFETVTAHVCRVKDFLEVGNYSSFLYLSSTRIYSGAEGGTEEGCSTNVNSAIEGDLYNISKLMGEAICMSVPNRNVRIARLSNVIGDDFTSENFVTSIIREIKETGTLTLRSSLLSSKDYITVSDAIDLLFAISTSGQERLYNVASGENITNEGIIDFLLKRIQFILQNKPGLPAVVYPSINISRINREFSFKPSNIYQTLDKMISNYFNLSN